MYDHDYYKSRYFMTTVVYHTKMLYETANKRYENIDELMRPMMAVLQLLVRDKLMFRDYIREKEDSERFQHSSKIFFCKDVVMQQNFSLLIENFFYLNYHILSLSEKVQLSLLLSFVESGGSPVFWL